MSNLATPAAGSDKAPALPGAVFARWRQWIRTGRWILWLTAIALVILWAEVIYTVRTDRGNETKHLINANETFAWAFEEHSQKTLRVADLIVRILRREYELNGAAMDIPRMIEQGVFSDDETFIFLGVIDEKGSLVKGSQAFAPVNFADRAYFRVHQPSDTGRPYVGVPTEDPASGRQSIQLSRRINKADGSFGGVAVASLDPNHFSRFYDEPSLGKAGLVYMVGTDGVVRAHGTGNGNDSAIGQNISHADLFGHLRQAANGSYRAASAIDGVRRLFSYRALPEYDLVVAIGKAEDEAFASFNMRVSEYYSYAAILTAGIVLLSATLLIMRRRETVVAEKEAFHHVELSLAQGLISKSNSRFDRAVHGSDYGIWDWDIVNDEWYFSPRFKEMLGYQFDEIGNNFLDFTPLLDSETREMLRAQTVDHLKRRVPFRVEFQATVKTGELRWFRCRGRAVWGADGVAAHMSGTLADITAGKRDREELERRTNYDMLTGLANRNLLLERLKHSLTHAHRYERLVAVLVLNLDRFKSVNDSLGQSVGDAFLKATGDRLSACVRDSDTVARLSADEFGIVLYAPASEDTLLTMMLRMQDAVTRPHSVGSNEITLSSSLGYTLFPRDGNDAENLLAHAVAAMHRAKQKGQSTIQSYDPAITSFLGDRLRLAHQLRSALSSDQLALHYQPQIDLASGSIIGAEALVRWLHPERGMVSPAEFIPVAEETGLIVPIGEWVLRTACAQNKAWQDAGLPPMCVAVNLSARQFHQKDLVGSVERVLAETGLAPRFLELELTESLLMDNAEDFIDSLRALKAIGVLISIDDFGTGYSSLSYLQRFPVDRLKIDQSFVRAIGKGDPEGAIVRTVIALAHNLRFRVIAEGVEQQEQLDFLRKYGCDEAQGYFFCRPVPAAELADRLEKTPALS